MSESSIESFLLIGIFYCTHRVSRIGREVDWVQCDGGCNEWFHMLCVGLVKSQMKPEDEFICKKCKSKKPANSATANSTSSSSTSKKVKSQISLNNTAAAAANGNGVADTKKRFTRSKEEATRDKTMSTTTTTNDNSIDSSKENEPRPNVSPKREGQSINTSRPKEKSN